jgi:hypothetical protein
MSLVADGPLIQVSGQAGSSLCSASATVRTIWSDLITHRWWSGTRVSARRPWSAPPSRMIVPVSAMATAQPVTTMSTRSRSYEVGIGSSRRTASAPASQASGTPAGAATRRPCTAAATSSGSAPSAITRTRAL